MQKVLPVLALLLSAPPLASDRETAAAAIVRLGGTFEAAPSGTGTILRVDLHGSGVKDADLAFLSSCPDLQSLDLRLTKVSDAGLVHVRSLRGLQFLNLFRTNVTDAGLASLAGLVQLETLLVGGTAVTDGGLDALKALTKLRKLSVFDTRVTDAGLKSLWGLKKLEALSSTKSGVTDAGLEELRKHVPAVRFLEGASAPVNEALFRIEGEAFVAPAKNEALQALLAKKPALTFFEACGVGDAAEVARRLKEDPARAHSWNDLGWSTLHLAAFSGSAETVRLLLDGGAGALVGARARTKFRNTPLQAALLSGQYETAKLLLERGADPNVRQAKGFTPLHEAALLGRRDLVDLLLAHGAELNARADDGRTAVTEALRGKHADLADTLRSRGGTGAEITANVLAAPE
jgi:hypothetical protein